MKTSGGLGRDQKANKGLKIGPLTVTERTSTKIEETAKKEEEVGKDIKAKKELLTENREAIVKTETTVKTETKEEKVDNHMNQ